MIAHSIRIATSFLIFQMYRGLQCDSVNSTAVAIVASHDASFATFKQAERQFHFGRHKITIHQQWEEVGVAAVVWDAAIQLCQHLSQHPQLVLGHTVLELGAGTGIVGMLAAMLGGYVTITDRELALDIIHKNLDINLKNYKVKSCRNLPNAQDISTNCDRLHCDLSMQPSIEPNDTNAKLGLESISVKELEWGKDHLNFVPFNVILGADIVYLEETFPVLIETLEHLSVCETVVLLSSKIRYQRDRHFLKLLRNKFDVVRLKYVQDVDIHIHSARLKGCN